MSQETKESRNHSTENAKQVSSDIRHSKKVLSVNNSAKEPIRQIVRIINKDIFGKIQIYTALTKILGVNYSFSNAVCSVLNIPKQAKLGALTQEQIKKIEDVIKNPQKYSMPSYLFNRKKDFNTGEDKHISTAELKLTKDFDIKRIRKLKSYKGMRHSFKLPVRGQRTRAHFRKGKALGVSKKKTGKKT